MERPYVFDTLGSFVAERVALARQLRRSGMMPILLWFAAEAMGRCWRNVWMKPSPIIRFPHEEGRLSHWPGADLPDRGL